MPLGYKRTKAGRLAIDESTAPVVRELFERRLDGARPRDLVELLAERRVPSYHGGSRWSEGAVRGLISRRAYLGEVSHGPDMNPSAHPALIDPATWQAAQFPKQDGPGPRSKDLIGSALA